MGLEARVTKYSTQDKTQYDEVLNNYVNVQYTDEVNGPGSGAVTIPVLDPKLRADPTLLSQRNIITVLDGEQVQGRFVLQTRELIAANGAQSGDLADRQWVLSGEGLRTLTHDAVVFPENGTVNSTTPSSRYFNFATIAKSQWYNASQWVSPVKGPKYLAKDSQFGKWPTQWPITDGYWIWGDNGIAGTNTTTSTTTTTTGSSSGPAVVNDYPWPNADTSAFSPLRYVYRQCTDFVAWRLNRDNGVRKAPWKWTWSRLRPSGGDGDAIGWKKDWEILGWKTGISPVAGCVAWFGSKVGSKGHVAYVQSTQMVGNTRYVTLEEYNWGDHQSYDFRTIPASEVDSFLQAPPGTPAPGTATSGTSTTTTTTTFKETGSGTSPIGTNYFRAEFSITETGVYSVYAAGDDAMDLFLDGSPIANTAPNASSFDQTTSVTGITLEKGTHVVAAAVYNKRGRAGFICAVRLEPPVGATVTTTRTSKSGKKTTTTKAAPAKTILVTGDSNWKVCAYPLQEPGWTPGEVMLQLWSEAQARGVEFPKYLKPTFTASHDSNGVPWPTILQYSFNMNSEYYDVVSAMEGQVGDIYFDPHDYSFNMYVEQGVDRTAGIIGGPRITSSGAPVYNYLGSPTATAGPAFSLSIPQRMQDFARFPDTGQFYVTQERDPGATGQLGDTTVEDVWITRLDSSGKKLDSMVLVDAGHGSEISVQSNSGGAPYIWVTYAKADSAGHTNDLVRFPYKAGTFTRSQVPGLQVMPKFSHGDGYVSVQFDWQNNWVAMQYGLDPVDNYELRKIDELIAGTDHVYATLNLTQGGTSGIANQGYFTYQQSLFRYTGGTNSQANPSGLPLLTEYNWADGSVVATYDASRLGKNSSGNYPGNWYEPEGAALYYINGVPTAYLGFTFNPYGSHTYQVWTIPLRTQAQAEAAWTAGGGTQDPPMLRLGQNVTTADETSIGAVKNGLLVQTSDGWVYKTDSTSLSEYGRIEGGAQVSVNTLGSDSVIASTFQQLSTPGVSTTYQVHANATLLPGVHFRVGDWLLAPALGDPSMGTLEKRRVMSITYSADTQNNSPYTMYALELDTIYQDRLTQLGRLISRLNNSDGITSSQNSLAVPSTGAGDTVPSAGNQSSSPQGEAQSIDPPDGFEVDTIIGGYNSAGTPVCTVSLDWLPPQDSDGNDSDVAYYEVYGSSQSVDWALLARAEMVEVAVELPVNETWTLSVRAIAGWDSSLVSEFSTPYVIIDTTGPLTPLDPPTAPTVTSKLGVVTVAWDGNLISQDTGLPEAPPAQLASVRVQVYADGNRSGEQIMGQAMSTAGEATITGLSIGTTYWFQLLAFDTAGLGSAPSVAVSATVNGVDLGSLDQDLAAQIANQRSADSVFSPTDPGSDYHREGVLWFDTAHSNLIRRWSAADNQWELVPLGAGALGPNSVTADNIAAGQIEVGALAAGAVTSDSIATGAILSQKIGAGEVKADNIATKAVSANKIDVGAITAENLVVGAVPVPSTDRVNNQPTDVNWWSNYALPLLNTGGAGIPNWTYNNENNRVTATKDGLVFDTTSGQRALIGLTAMYPVPPSNAVAISWSGTGLLPVRVRENNPGAAGGVIWGTYGTTKNAKYTFQQNTTTYGVYVEVPANNGAPLLVSLHVFEVIGQAAGTNQQGVLVSPAGIEMTSASGNHRITLGTDSNDVIVITSDDPNNPGNPAVEVQIDNTGTGTFQQLDVANDVAIQGSNLMGGRASNLQNALANGQPWPVGGSLDTTDMGMLDVAGRSVPYQAAWTSTDGKSVSTRYYFIASNSFQVEDGRMVMLLVNNGGIAIDNPSTTRVYGRTQIALAAFNDTAVDGTTIGSAVVQAGSYGSVNTQPTVWTTQQMASGTEHIDYVNYILPANVPIFWQYYLDMSATPNAAYTIHEFGQYRAMNLIDLGSNAIVNGAPVPATDARGGTAQGTGGSSGTGTTTVTKTYPCSWSASYHDGGNTPVNGTGTYTDAHMLYQGVGVTGMGAMFGFPALNLTGKTITGVQLYLRNRSTATGSAITVHMRTDTKTSAPSSLTAAEGSQTFSWGNGQGKWVTLPQSWWSGIGSGLTRSFQIGVDSTHANYGYFDGFSKSSPPQLKITFR